MPINANSVGLTTKSIKHTATTRDILAFASVFPELAPSYLDDANEGQFRALPMYVVRLEWKIVQALRQAKQVGFTSAEQLKGVQVTQDSRFYRSIEPGTRLSAQGHLAGIRQSQAGAVMDTDIVIDNEETGKKVSKTRYTSIFRNVSVNGPDQPVRSGPEPNDDSLLLEDRELHIIPRGLPHVYSECSDIWNPIHTERKVALESGLPDIVVHGTALWTLAAIWVMNARADADYSRIKRLHGRFTAMVLPGSEITLLYGGSPGHPTMLRFKLLNAQSEEAISGGLIELE